MAILGKWSGGVIGTQYLTASWAAPNGLFPTEDRNDSSAYTFTSSTSTLTLPSSGLADGYLLIAAFEHETSQNDRHMPQGKIVQASGSGTFVGAPTGGYARDNSEDRAYVRCWAFVDGPSASSTYQFQWKRDNEDANAGDGTNRSEFQVIPLYYSDFGAYTSSSTSSPGGTTPNVIGSFTGTDGTNITISGGNIVSCTGDNKYYLVLGSYFYEGVSGRTQRWGGLDVDGTQEDAAKAYTYYRQGDNDESGELYSWLIETDTATVTLEHTLYRGDGVLDGEGGADVDLNTTSSVGDHALVVLELNDSAEVFLSRDNTQSANIATTGPVDLQINTVTDFNDTASFTDVVDTSINVVQDSDCLFGANISAASGTVSSGSRWTAYAEITVNGTEDADSFSGDYLRGNQSSQDTFGWSANLLGFQALSAGDDVGVSVTELSGSEGGGGNVYSPAGWSGFWGINLDTLEAVGSQDITPSSIAGAEAFGTAVITVDQDVLPSAITSAEAFGAPEPTNRHLRFDSPVSTTKYIFDNAALWAESGQTITATGIASAEAFGTASISLGDVDTAPSSIASLEAFGTHVLSVGAVELTPASIASLEAFGTHVLSLGVVDIAPNSILTAEGFGTAALTVGVVNIDVASINSDEAFGTVVLATGSVDITPAGIGTAEGFGTHSLGLGAVEITPTGIVSLEALGDAVVTTVQDISPSAIASAEVFGAHVLTAGVVDIAPTGLASGEAFGAHALTFGVVEISTTGVVSDEAFGGHTLTTGPIDVEPAGIASEEALGATVISVGAADIAPTGIVSLEAFGTHVIGLDVVPAGIASAEAFGTHSLSLGSVDIEVSAIVSAEAFGTHGVQSGASFVLPTGLVSGEAFGDTTVTAGGVEVLPGSIGTAEAFGTHVVSLGATAILPGAIGSLEAFGANTITLGVIVVEVSAIASEEGFGAHVVAITGGAPTAAAGVDQVIADNNGTGNAVVTLDGSGSVDLGGSIVSYEWYEGAVLIATGVSPSIPLDVGVHLIDLVVTDNDTNTDTDQVIVTVNALDRAGGGSSKRRHLEEQAVEQRRRVRIQQNNELLLKVAGEFMEIINK